MGRVKRTGTVAIIGSGEMGAAVGQRLRETGARVLTTLEGRGSASVQRFRRAQLEVVEEDDLLVREASFILSIVPPGQAVAVAERFRAPMMRATEKADLRGVQRGIASNGSSPPILAMERICPICSIAAR